MDVNQFERKLGYKPGGLRKGIAASDRN